MSTSETCQPNAPLHNRQLVVSHIRRRHGDVETKRPFTMAGIQPYPAPPRNEGLLPTGYAGTKKQSALSKNTSTPESTMQAKESRRLKTAAVDMSAGKRSSV